MTARQSFWKTFPKGAVLKGAIRVWLGICALSFLFGGGVVRAWTTTNRTLAEIEGIGIAGVCLILTAVFSRLVDNNPDTENAEGADDESMQK